MHKKLSQLQHDGFTLIEVMVSVSIFVIIITIGIGSLLTVNRALQKSRIERQAIDSLSYAMDTMTRRIRTGTNYDPSQGEFRFIEQNDTADGNNGTGQLVIFDRGVDNNDYGFIRLNGDKITPPEINITNLSFTVMRGNVQPLVLISIKATIKNQDQESVVAIQSAVSQRPFEQQTTAPVTP
jgi:prepilin-type N-terminal cleavage/methylation domain-containing protein